MGGVICYYSATGNTQLVCEYLARHLEAECELVDTIAHPAANLTGYDFVGLAAPTDFGSPPEAFERFIASLDVPAGTPAFVLNTYGFMSGRTQRDLAEQAAGRGLVVLAAHSIRTPENYPPMISGGLGFPNRPNVADLRKLDAFVARLGEQLGAVGRGDPAGAPALRFPLAARLSRHRDRTSARRDMGEKFVDAQACTECGTCARRCPYAAIALSPKPVFDMTRCYGCWRCYNGCPQRAISTKRFPSGPFYPHPSDHAREVLGR